MWAGVGVARLVWDISGWCRVKRVGWRLVGRRPSRWSCHRSRRRGCSLAAGYYWKWARGIDYREPRYSFSFFGYPRIDGTQSSRFAITATAPVPNWFLAYTTREVNAGLTGMTKHTR